jgi:NAD-dependent dihydropyrimidine dehydrogenase PreA subunit
MAHIIAQPCIGTKDTACVTVCPVDCIHPTKNDPDFETAEMLYIDPDTCIDCGLCVDECPVTAIFPQEDCPANGQSSSRRTRPTSRSRCGRRTDFAPVTWAFNPCLTPFAHSRRDPHRANSPSRNLPSR